MLELGDSSGKESSIAVAAGCVISETTRNDMTVVEVLEVEMLDLAHHSTVQACWEESLATHLPCEAFDRSEGIRD